MGKRYGKRTVREGRQYMRGAKREQGQGVPKMLHGLG